MLTSEESSYGIIASKLSYTRCMWYNQVWERCGFLSYFYAATKFDLGDIIILLTVYGFLSPDWLSTLSTIWERFEKAHGRCKVIASKMVDWHQSLLLLSLQRIYMMRGGLLGGQVVKALDCTPRGPRFQPHYSNRYFFHLGVYSALPKIVKFTLHPSEGM